MLLVRNEPIMILHSTNLPLSNQRGIALGPVLFIIAILAILAAAIAAGSGAFNANTRDENGKAMAEVVINSCHAYQDALQIMLHNECEETKLDFTPMGWPDGSTAAFQNGDFTGGNGTNRAGNGRCAFFHPQGGGMFFKPLPAAALVTNPTGAYTASTASYSGEIATNIDAFAGYPDFQGDTCQYHGGSCQGAQNNSALYLKYYYLNYSTCQQINSILKLNFDPNSTNLTL